MSAGAVPRVARIAGSGMAAASAAVSLTRFGWQVTMSPPARPRRGHAIALNSASRYLLDRLWPGLMTGLPHHHLSHRVVLWREGAAQRIDEPGDVVDAAGLAERMMTRLAAAGARLNEAAREGASWTILATGRVASDAATSPGGRRIAFSAPVHLATTADRSGLLIEAVSTGWIGLLPTGMRSGIVFACTLPSPNAPAAVMAGMMAESRLARRGIAALADVPSVLAAAPALRREHGDATVIHAGDAALAFDPISGDGAAAALRSAHLAAALGEAYACGTALGALRAFHDYRLERAMSVHLQGLLAFYGDAPFARLWRDECAAMRAWAKLLQRRLAGPKPPLFALSEAGLSARP
jgi:2-polyprenyl-6-methoxyphenol hydroxylase-like FAD-dependent oxidoreductase